MLSGLPLAGLDGVPSETVAADDDELVADEPEAAVLDDPLLLQAATARARTLSPAAAIALFMLDVPPLLGKCRVSYGHLAAPPCDPAGVEVCQKIRAMLVVVNTDSIAISSFSFLDYV